MIEYSEPETRLLRMMVALERFDEDTAEAVKLHISKCVNEEVDEKELLLKYRKSLNDKYCLFHSEFKNLVLNIIKTKNKGDKINYEKVFGKFFDYMMMEGEFYINYYFVELQDIVKIADAVIRYYKISKKHKKLKDIEETIELPPYYEDSDDFKSRIKKYLYEKLL